MDAMGLQYNNPTQPCLRQAAAASAAASERPVETSTAAMVRSLRERWVPYLEDHPV